MATVLIVDDRPVNRDLVRTVLGYQGHRTIEAPGGVEALELLRRERPDVVVADVLMPGMDGYELARAIRADPAINDIPVLFYTANYVESEIRSIAASVGVERVVRKSGDLTELVDAIDDTLGAATPEQIAVITSEEEFGREHLRVVNAKLLEKITELEEAARLHEMVEAIVAVGDDPEWGAVLVRVAEAAFALVDAAHVSLVTTAAEGRPSEIVSVGNDSATAQRVADLASGGAFTSGRQPTPGLHTVPIRIGAELFATLVLARRPGDRFGPAEHRLLDTFARAAGIAVANSQLYDDARRREEWHAASAEVTSTMLGADPAEASRLIANGARRVLDADSSWIVVPSSSDAVVIEACEGEWCSLLRGHIIPLAEASLYAQVSASTHAVVVTDARSDERTADTAGRLQLPAGPMLAVPLRASGVSLGALYVANAAGSPPFSALDVEMVRAFARRAALTLEFARAEEHRRRLTLSEDRNRIARDLHDVVIQRLFGMGLRLERLRGQLPLAAADEVAAVTEDLDRTIDSIRTTIFSLRADDDVSPSLRAEFVKIMEPASVLLSFAPHLRIEGPIDRAVPDEVRAHVLATFSEALSNSIRHAQASRVDILVRVAGDELLLQVTDDGRGLPADRHESGLANLRRRATDLGGTMSVGSGPRGLGTTLTWCVPLPGGSGQQPAATVVESAVRASEFN
ncbi:MAG: hypothetical protein QOE97_1517 [Pseudonocardiales bacterium]|nr:hypothetical protein [Pseudonocardiales bacterium]